MRLLIGSVLLLLATLISLTSCAAPTSTAQTSTPPVSPAPQEKPTTPTSADYTHYSGPQDYAFDYPNTFTVLESRAVKTLNWQWELVLGEGSDTQTQLRICCTKFPNVNNETLGNQAYPITYVPYGLAAYLPVSGNMPEIVTNYHSVRVFHDDNPGKGSSAYIIDCVSPNYVYEFMIYGIGQNYYSRIDEIYMKFMSTLSFPNATAQPGSGSTTYTRYTGHYNYAFDYPSTFTDLSSNSEVSKNLTSGSLLLGEYKDDTDFLVIRGTTATHFPENQGLGVNYYNDINYNWLSGSGYTEILTSLPQTHIFYGTASVNNPFAPGGTSATGKTYIVIKTTPNILYLFYVSGTGEGYCHRVEDVYQHFINSLQFK